MIAYSNDYYFNSQYATTPAALKAEFHRGKDVREKVMLKSRSKDVRKISVTYTGSREIELKLSIQVDLVTDLYYY